jgi:hypothetical protein
METKLATSVWNTTSVHRIVTVVAAARILALANTRRRRKASEISIQSNYSNNCSGGREWRDDCVTASLEYHASYSSVGKEGVRELRRQTKELEGR